MERMLSTYDWSKPLETLNSIKQNLEKIVAKEEEWYRNLRIIHGSFTRLLRFAALGLFGFGTIYPILAKGTNLQWGYVSLAIGSFILLMDKYFGISTSFVRFYKAEIEIRDSTRMFGLDWEIEMVKAEGNFSKDNVLNILDVAKKYGQAVSTIIASETVSWATEFNTQIGELQQELMKKENSYKTGNLSVAVTNWEAYSDMELTLDKTSQIKLEGDTSTVFRNISIAPHTVSFKGKNGERQIEFSKNIDVTADKTAELVIDLP